MEVNAQPTSLLNVPKEVSDLLLSYLAPAEGGVQSILNLRAVSSTTKGWVDELLPAQRRRFLGKCEVVVELSKKSVEKFVKIPSPPAVTSLRLKEVTDDDDDDEEEWEELGETVWNSFVEFWSPRLECLHLDGSFLLKIPSLEIIRLCSSSRFLSSLRCQDIDHFDEDLNKFPKFLFELEELSVRDFGACQIMNENGNEEKDFFHLLVGNKNLKHLEVSAATPHDILGVVKVIDANKDNSAFKLTLGFEKWEPGYGYDPDFDEPFPYLVTSVALAKCAISIVNLGSIPLRAIAEFGESEQMATFCEKVETLCYFNELRRSLFLTVFPNLKQIGNLHCSRSRGLSLVRDLEKLERLAIADLHRGGKVPSVFLPSSLTHLDLKTLMCSPTELVHILNYIAINCPLLNSLRIEWTVVYEAGQEFGTGSIPMLLPASFSNLKIFTFKADLSFLDQNEAEENAEVFRMILMQGVRIPQLSLHYFQFKLLDEDEHPTIGVLNTDTVRSMIEGPLAKNLLVFSVESDAYPEEAAPLVMKLKSKALSNKMKRVKSHGLRLPFSDDSAF